MKKKYFPRTLDDAIEADRCRIEIFLGRKLAPYEELNYTHLSNRVGEYWERHKKDPLIMIDYERDKFNYFLNKVHEYFNKCGGI